MNEPTTVPAYRGQTGVKLEVKVEWIWEKEMYDYKHCMSDQIIDKHRDDRSILNVTDIMDV